MGIRTWLVCFAVLAASATATRGRAEALKTPKCSALEAWANTVDARDRYTPLPGNRAWLPKVFGEPAFAALFGKPALALTRKELGQIGARLGKCRKAATRAKRYDAQKSLNAARGVLIGRLKRVLSAKAGMQAAAKARSKAESTYRERKEAARQQHQRGREKALQTYVGRLLGQPDSPELLRDLALLRSGQPLAPNALVTPFARNFPDYASGTGRSANDPDIAARIDARIARLRPVLIAEVERQIAAVPSTGKGPGRVYSLLVGAEQHMGPGLRDADRARLRALAAKRQEAIRIDLTRLAKQNIARLPVTLSGLTTLRRWQGGIARMDVSPAQRAEIAKAAAQRQLVIADALLQRAQAGFDSLPANLDGVARLQAQLTALAPARVAASPAAVTAFSDAASRRLEVLRRGALPDFRKRLAALPESRAGLAKARKILAENRAAPATMPLRDEYLAAVAARHDAIAAAVDAQDRGRREAAIAAGGDPRLVGLRFHEPTAGMSLEFRDPKTVFIAMMGMRAAGDYVVSENDVVVHGPHGQIVLTIDGDHLVGMGLNFARQED